MSETGFADGIAATDSWLYALETDGRVSTFARVVTSAGARDEWDNITDGAAPGGLGGQLVSMIATTPSFLYVLTKSGRVYGRVPGSGSSRRWERVDLPAGAKCVDLRSHGGKLFGTSEAGKVLVRKPGVGWE